MQNFKSNNPGCFLNFFSNFWASQNKYINDLIDILKLVAVECSKSNVKPGETKYLDYNATYN